MATRVAVIEYGVGNVGSVVNACARIGADVAIARDGDELRAQAPEAIILPGVGAFGAALELIRSRGFEAAVGEQVHDAGVPFLGICVGMQALADSCEEFGEHHGLGWIPGTVCRLVPPGSPVRLPHVGWNTVDALADDPVLGGLAGAHFYFVHSYAMRCDRQYVVGTTEYGGTFPSAVRIGHAWGIQFHAEKSSLAGERLLGQFLAFADACSSGG